MPRPFISAYTPSNTEAALLQRIFVQRHPLLKQIVTKLEHSIRTGDKYHILLIGPRGSGKTHLLTLAHHQLVEKAKLDAQLRENMRVAWLGEDATFTDLVDIALAMADALSARYPDEFNQNYRQLARGYQSNEAALIILNALLKDLGQRTIVLMTENMDRTFNNIGDMGQKTWRAFMQEHPCITTQASAQQLVEAVSSRDQPFFGFFGIEHLAPLSAEDAQKLIQNIATEQGNTELAEFLSQPVAQYRIRALHYLAGGNHRMYVILSELLSQANLDDLVAAFESLADELTPYFQERVRSLPAQQAKIVEYLCSITGAANVKSIAEDTFIAETSCSKQLSELSRKKYVRARKNGKETFYEMNEPLMRLCLDIKNQHGNPLKLITQFIRAWFSNADLEKQMGQLNNPRSRLYCIEAMHAEPIYALPLKDELNQLIDESLQKNDLEKALKHIAELHYSDENEAKQVEEKLRITLLSNIIAQADTPVERIAQALFNRGLCYSQQGKADAEIADYTAIINLPNAPVEPIAMALLNRGVCYSQQGKTDAAIADYTAVINLPNAPVEPIAMALLNRGVCYTKPMLQ